MNRKKKVLFLTSEFPPLPGGIGNQAYNLTEYLQKLNYNVSIVADQRGTIEEELKFDKGLLSTVFRIKKNKLRGIMYFKRMIKFFKEVRTADYIICSGKFPLWLGAISKMMSKRQHIAIIHGSEVNFKNSILKESINRALINYDKVVAVSKYTQNLVSHLRLKFIKVIPNGYNHEKWDVSKNIEFELTGSPKLLTVGNVTKRKGQANVIRHLPEILKDFPELHYHCVGINTELVAMEKLAENLGVKQSVTFHGHVSHNTLQMFYQSVDICVMLSNETSTGDVEGFGIALIEANHFGVPTIGSFGCGIEDAIKDKQSGILINGLISSEFKRAIHIIKDNKDYYEKEAVKWAEKHQWATIIENYIELLEK